MTLKEYLEDYALEDTKKKGEKIIRKEIKNITSKKIEGIVEDNLKDIEKGKRDFRF